MAVARAPSPVPARQATRAPSAAARPAAARLGLETSAVPLDHSTRADLEERFGHRFDRVRIHEGSEAARSARAMDAFAYTVGTDVVLGEAANGHDARRHILAHEWAHVVQQGGAPPLQANGHGKGAGGPSRGAEQDAEAAARQALAGHPPVALPVQPVGLYLMGNAAAPAPPATVWAEQADSHLRVCEDASTRDGAGQPGWDLGVNFATLSSLLVVLRQRSSGRPLRRLAIVAHGLPGEVKLEGERRPGLNADRMYAATVGAATLPDDPEYNANPAYFRSLVQQISEVGSFLASDGTVMLAGCLAGQGREGARLLRLLADVQGFNRRVVAFTTLTAQMGDQLRTGQNCANPGTRVTNEMHPMGMVGVHTDHSGERLEWASEGARHARIATPEGTVHDNDTGTDEPAPSHWPTTPEGWPTFRPEIELGLRPLRPGNPPRRRRRGR